MSKPARRSVSFVRSLGLVAAVTVVGAGCQSGSSPQTPAPSGPPSQAATAPPSQPSTPDPTTPAGSTPGATPGESPGTPGSYAVTLTGPKTGAGSYTGTTLVLCAATEGNGRLYWSASAIILSGPFGSLTDFTLQQNPSGWDSVSATAGGMDTGSWFARSDGPGDTATVTGSGTPGSNGRVSGEGTFQDGTATYSIQISAACSDTSY